MNQNDYAIYQEGMAAASRGAGLSDSPYGGREGLLWRQGVRAWLDEHDQDGRAGGLQEGDQDRLQAAGRESRKVGK
jgi:hypothetical protein